MDDLGDQVLTLVRRRRVKATDYVDTGERIDYPGWSLQPMPPEEQNRAGLSVTERWQGYGPGGTDFATQARAQDHVQVAPGPRAADGSPLRLQLDGTAASWTDLDATEDHVAARFVRTTGAS